MKKLRDSKKNKKGFTLVELIVVLVILAILMAILIPALTGYIRKAQEKQVMAEGRVVEMAAQSALSDAFTELVTDEATLMEDIDELIGDDADITTGHYAVTVSQEDYKITQLIYTDGKKVAVYNGTTWSVDKDATAPTKNSVTITTTPAPDPDNP